MKRPVGVKWSAFENCGAEAKGVTKYQTVKKYKDSKYIADQEQELRKQLKNMTKVFQPGLFDILTRQESISKHCVPDGLHPHAAALGNQWCRNV